MDANEAMMWVSHAQTSLEFSGDEHGATKLGEAVDNLRAELKTLRMADDLNQQGAEHMREEVARLKGELAALKARYDALLDTANHNAKEGDKNRYELAALKAAASAALSDWHGGLEPHQTDTYDELARLCGEG